MKKDEMNLDLSSREKAIQLQWNWYLVVKDHKAAIKAIQDHKKTIQDHANSAVKCKKKNIKQWFCHFKHDILWQTFFVPFVTNFVQFGTTKMKRCPRQIDCSHSGYLIRVWSNLLWPS